MTLGRVIAGMAGAAVVYDRLVRPRLLRWGATDEEVIGPYPGAGIVPEGERGTTMAVTIDAPPERVWPWLVQLGTTSTTPAGRVPGRSTPSGRSAPSGTS
jgi:proline iminopeptidase